MSLEARVVIQLSANFSGGMGRKEPGFGTEAAIQLVREALFCGWLAILNSL